MSVQSPIPSTPIPQNDQVVSSSWFSPNWEKVIVVANTALIIAGIAAGFFMKLPLLVAGLGLYGTAYLLFNTLAARQVRDEARQIEEDIRIKQDKLDDINASISSAHLVLKTPRKAIGQLPQKQREHYAQFKEVYQRWKRIDEFVRVARERGDVQVTFDHLDQVMKGEA